VMAGTSRHVWVPRAARANLAPTHRNLRPQSLRPKKGARHRVLRYVNGEEVRLSLPRTHPPSLSTRQATVHARRAYERPKPSVNKGQRALRAWAAQPRVVDPCRA